LIYRSIIGDVIHTIFGPVANEKLVMAPNIGYWPSIRNPRSFNEKVAHRKLFTSKSEFAKFSDKYEVREYVRDVVGTEVLTEVYWVGNNPAEIPFENLPDQIVIKSTHSSGHVRLYDNLQRADHEEVRTLCEEWMTTEFGGDKGEYWYTGITPRIIIEERLHDDEFDAPPDYKFFVFNGSVEVIQVDLDRFGDHTRVLYNTDWEKLEVTYAYEQSQIELDKPNELGRMIKIAEQLGSGLDFVRVDLYEINGDRIVFGEMTFAPEAGTGRFQPKEWDFKLGSYW